VCTRVIDVQLHGAQGELGWDDQEESGEEMRTE
jgi:hypothetical protein